MLFMMNQCRDMRKGVTSKTIILGTMNSGFAEYIFRKRETVYKPKQESRHEA